MAYLHTSFDYVCMLAVLDIIIISLLGRQITLTCKMYVVISINSVAYYGISSVSNAVK